MVFPMHESKTAGAVKLLDCTLRDGGYYNDWDFSLAEAQDYIDNMVRGGVDIIEVGFRFTPKSKFLGPFAYTRESLLKRLELPEGVQFGVMVNASDYLGDDWKEQLEAAFSPEAESAVSLVRIAAHIGQIPKCDRMVAWFKDAGYDVGLNVMQISQADDAQITALVEDVEARFVPFEALYFADSLGNLTTDDVIRIVSLFRASSPKPIGFHGHDNIGLGVANSMAVLRAGATWVDATVTGMGRGAGNTQMEYLSLEMSRQGIKDLNLLDIQRAATGWLADLKARCNWGTNIFYYEAGLKSLHPSYVQQMISSNRYEPVDILVMIGALSGGETPTSYSEANIERALAELMHAPEGTGDVTGIWQDRPVMLVAGGLQATRHWPAVSQRARAAGAVIVAVNHNDAIPASEFDAVVCIHPARMMSLVGDKTWASLPLYTARGAMPDSLTASLSRRDGLVDYGVNVEANSFSAGPLGCTIPAPEALAFAWALAKQAGASELLLAGFDGHDGRSDAFVNTSKVLAQLRANCELPVCSVTATYFDLPQDAVYAR